MHGLGNGLPQHKLATQQLHSAQGGGHHGAGAEFGKQAAGGLAVGQKLLAQGNGAAGQACQRLVAGGGKVGAPELVGGQGDGGFSVGHAQQGLGQAHQGQALGAGNRVFLEQAFHGPERRRVVAHGLHPGGGLLGGIGPVQGVRQGAQALGDDLSFRAVGVG